MKRSIISAIALAGTLLTTSAHAWWEADWQFRKAMAVDTTPQGANIAEAPGRTTVLVRLHTGNFAFDGMNENGSDLRFVGADDKTPLHHQIESFDPLLGVAQIWVDLPTVQGGQRQDFWMYYGNQKASAAANGQQVFDPDYVGVYQFGDGIAVNADTTVYGNNAQSVAGDVIDGVVGKALQLKGQPLTLPASPSLALAAGGAFTFSAWLHPDQIDGQQLIYARRDGTNAMLIGLAQGVPFIEINGQKVQASSAFSAAQWQHLAVTASGAQTVLYVNGKAEVTLAAGVPGLNGVTTIGADVPGSTVSDYKEFSGAIDEVRLSRIARPAALILADANMQGADSKMVAYGVDEKASGVGFGAFGFIFSSVPLDAWIVMAVLMVMMLHSWWVMVTKNRYLTRVVQANQEFREQFSNVGTRLDALALQHQLADLLKESSLWRIYSVAIKELKARKAQGMDLTNISAATLESIRVSMDAVRIRENEVLGARMGGLSNAIAGGPYIGLFGTVIGIMLVFAHAAMAGDVNINAVAPGMAAALLATAAGLLVAIPALFGYNHLLGRNKGVITDMRVFVDEFTTRLAEIQGAERGGDTANGIIPVSLHKQVN